ncbi:hypothetical protein QQX09_09885 [Demequina sp. SYSU T00192]|uniref:Gram-positive cocci surface proteins LPxTG domain-containing protein n=1 Tax=Demequina litoralis TaxID=3051660 RepID=A0ABT8GAJ8_9MICO|nr:hypothetical protein [Demequina sp. SYSU T00192]MDN4476162.1 hypothetical protein [Demequina sp. SYSU T00192]
MQNRHLGRAAAVLGLVVGAACIAAPASADAGDIVNASTTWEWVYDEGGRIDDAEARYPGLGPGGGAIWGWTSDAFDEFVFEYEFVTDDDDDYLDASDFDAVSSTRVDGGVSTFVSAAGFRLYDDVAGATFDYTATVTLTIEGSYAQWDVAVAADAPSADTARVIDAMTVGLLGNLGSDRGTVYEPVDASSMISHDEGGYDPIVAYHAVADSVVFDVVDGDDEPWVNLGLTSAGDASLIVALRDYAPCARDEAIAAHIALAPTLDASFGEDIYPPVQEDCASVEAPAPVEATVDFEQYLALTLEDVAVEGWDFLEAPETVFVDASVVEAPEGVDVALVEDEGTGDLYLAVAGVVAAPGTYDVLVAVYLSDGYESGYPYFVSFALTATEAVAAAPEADETDLEEVAEETTTAEDTTEEAVLADTGFDGAPLVALAGTLIALGAVSVARARRRA